MSDAISRARADLGDVTPGPWELRKTSTVYMDGTGVYHIRTDGVPGVRGALTVTRPDAEFIARFDPPTVSAMLDVIEAAEGWFEDDDQTPGHAVAEKKNVLDALARVRDLMEGNV